MLEYQKKDDCEEISGIHQIEERVGLGATA
jgi:hypothetical protein